MSVDLKNAELPCLCWLKGDETQIQDDKVVLVEVLRPCIITVQCPITFQCVGVFWHHGGGRHDQRGWWPIDRLIHPETNRLVRWKPTDKLPDGCVMPAGLTGRSAMGWFEITKSKDGQIKFVLKAGNAETILMSELFLSLRAADRAIAAVRTNCEVDDRYELKDSPQGKFYFLLKAADQQVVGTSRMYNTKEGRDNGLASVRMNGRTTVIKDET